MTSDQFGAVKWMSNFRLRCTRVKPKAARHPMALTAGTIHTSSGVFINATMPKVKKALMQTVRTVIADIFSRPR